MQTYTNPRGIVFTRVADEPYTRKDGGLTTLQVWHAQCQQPGCQEPIVSKCTQGADPSKAGNFSRVHCEKHKLSQKEATAKWAAACKASNTKATPEVLQEILALHAQGLSPSSIALLVPLSASRIYALIASNK